MIPIANEELAYSPEIRALTLYVRLAHDIDKPHRRVGMTATTKDTRLHIRCDQQVRYLLDKAAAYAHMSVSEFVLRNAVDQAQAVLEANESISLSQNDFSAFLAALDDPAPPNTALQRAFARHDEQVR